MDVSKFTREELDLIQDALTYYEQRHAGDKDKWNNMRGITSTFEAAARKQVADQEDETAQQFIGMMESLQEELQLHIEKENTSNKVERERITLLKAKMILVQQGKAVDQFLSGDE